MTSLTYASEMMTAVLQRAQFRATREHMGGNVWTVVVTVPDSPDVVVASPEWISDTDVVWYVLRMPRTVWDGAEGETRDTSDFEHTMREVMTDDVIETVRAMVSEPVWTALACSQCSRGDSARYDVVEGSDTATCVRCGHTVSIRHDVIPNLEDGETVEIRNGVLGYVSQNA
jgi:hypothetical protein